MIGRPTPERLFGRSGVLLSLILALVAIGGCDAVGSVGAGATIQLDSGEVQLPDGAEAHEVRITGAGAADSLAPAAVQAKPGDAVRFIVADRRTHALAFGPDGLTPDVRAYLERTAHLRGPPLVNEGAEWVVLLEGAPPGRYPFYCRSHDTRGVLVVGSND